MIFKYFKFVTTNHFGSGTDLICYIVTQLLVVLVAATLFPKMLAINFKPKAQSFQVGSG